MSDLKSQALTSVLNGKASERRPVWFMRQAGRYLPEYRKVREQAGSFLELCYSPELAAEVTLQPLRRYDIDAAIIFSDILVVPHAMGNGLSFVEGEGPKLETVRSSTDLVRLGKGSESKQFSSVAESISRVRKMLDPSISLIGFCGAPWTVASYMVEGGSSDRELARKCAYQREAWFLELISRLVENSIDYLCMQIEAGADVVQIFDSWAGELAGDLLTEYCIEPIRQIVAGVKLKFPEAPVIVFAKGAGYRHGEVYTKTGCQAVGVEAECSLTYLQSVLPNGAILQGNLDPILLLCDTGVVRRNTLDLVAAIPRRRHIFNLGHGIKPQTNPDILADVVKAIRDFDNGNVDG
ncbi:MAG: uroporphyrinogen decarboxylase [Aestuariivirga sp.]